MGRRPRHHRPNSRAALTANPIGSNSWKDEHVLVFGHRLRKSSRRRRISGGSALAAAPAR